MNILFIGPYKQIDKLGQHSYNLLGCLNSIPNINLVARSFQYNSLLRKTDEWCDSLEKKECCQTYDYIFQCCIPRDFVYTPNSIASTIIDPSKLNDDFLERKILSMPNLIVSSLNERLAVKQNQNITVIPTRIDSELKYKVYDLPKIDELGRSYIFYWVGEYNDEYCYKEVLQAFHLEFERGENAHLVMYFLGEQNQKNIEIISNGLRNIKFSINKYKNPDYYKNETIIIGGDLETIRSYHAHLDCYIDVNRGANNYSLIKEAMLFNKKIIANNGDSIKEPIINHQYYLPQNSWKYININDIRSHMRIAFENRQLAIIDENKLDYRQGGGQINEVYFRNN